MNRADIAQALLASIVLSATATAAPQKLLQSSLVIGGVDDVEVTPDERFAVMRVNNLVNYVRVQDLQSQAIHELPTNDVPCGEVLDAVAVSATRAVVLGGVTAAFVDIAQPVAPTIVAQPSVGYRPRDVAISPDGAFTAVRGGHTSTQQPQHPGGLFLFATATGALLWQGAGEPPIQAALQSPTSYHVDAVAITNRHAAFLSLVGSAASPATRITVVDLAPPGGGAPVLAFETGGACVDCLDLPGAPHDLVATPDGTRLYVRSELAVGAYDLGALVAPAWVGRLHGNPGAFDDEALDSIEATNERVATISRRAPAGAPIETQLDVYDRAGNQRHARFPGRPHDLAIVPDGTRVLARSSEGLAQYGLGAFPPGLELPQQGFVPAPATTYQYFAGFDSLAANDTHAVFTTRDLGATAMRIHVVDLRSGAPVLVATKSVSNSRPTDVQLLSDGVRAVVSGNSSLTTLHLGTATVLHEVKPVGAHQFYQWCDGVAAGTTRAVAVGQWGVQSGWSSVVDILVPQQDQCAPTPNSVGAGASLTIHGGISIAYNRLALAVDGLPVAARGKFVLGQGAAPTPFGAGSRCVASNAWISRFVQANAFGSLLVRVPVSALPPGVLAPGATVHAQFLYTDLGQDNASSSRAFVVAP
ncbi:MAG: hypothetical protein RL112_2690 [Planctomycetota bacterium]|jgi:hypothetical protein